jgi:hypothetical protein
MRKFMAAVTVIGDSQESMEMAAGRVVKMSPLFIDCP